MDLFYQKDTDPGKENDWFPGIQDNRDPGIQDKKSPGMPSLEDFQILTPENHFCYRWSLYKLTRNMKSMIHTLLIAPRGFGKQQIACYVSENIVIEDPFFRACHLDLTGIRSLKDFIHSFQESLIEFPLTDVQPVNDVSNPTEIEKMLMLPDFIAIKYRIKLVFTIGNIQVLFKVDPDFSLLRTMNLFWKESKHCVFLLYGNLEQTRRELIQSRRKLILGFLKIIFLPWPDHQGMIFTVKRQFSIHGKNIREDAIRTAISYCAQNPFYIRLLIWHAFLLTNEECTQNEIELALNRLLWHYMEYYRQRAESLTISQLNFLKALLEQWSGLCSREDLKRYDLRSSSRVARIRESLCRKEVIDVINREVYLTDPLFCQWLKRDYFR